MNTYLQNVRYGLRMLRNAPAFSVVAVITLALGIGATTAIFSIVNTVLLQPLPYRQPDRLMMVWGEKPDRGRQRPFSAPDFEDFRKQNDAFSDLSSFDEGTYTVTGGITPERIDGASVSSSFFSILAVTPEFGRAFVPADEQQSAVIVNRRTWRKWFGDAGSVEGKKITLDGKVYPVVGVVPDSFEFRSAGLNVWITPGYSADMLKFRGAHFLAVFGRLKPGVSASQAEAQMKIIASRLSQQYPDTDADTTVNLKPLREEFVGDIRLSLLVLLGAVCLVVLIACANVANLLLARATSRRKELAIRAALGASRARILAQLLTESVLLAVIGGALGLLIAFWGIAAVVRLWADQIPRAQDVHIDLTVMGFSLALSVLTGLVFGLAPALHTATPNLYEALKEAARSVGVSGRSQRLRHVLVVAELALAVVLVSGAGLLIRSFLRLQNVYPGFNASHLMTFYVELPSANYPKREQQSRFFEALLQRVESLPGVESAGAASTLPLGGNTISFSFDLLSRPLPRSQQMGSDFDAVAPNYFRAMQVPLLRGRFFTDHDSENATRVVILNRTFAERHFPNEDPIGQKMIISYMAQRVPYEVVGIVGDVKQRRLESAFLPHMYTPMTQTPWGAMSFVVRTSLDRASVASAVTREMQALDSNLPAAHVRTMYEVMADSVARQRLNMLLLGIFGGLALLLATVGVYGVMSYIVSQRSQEFGIRMALGAQRRDLVSLVIGQASRMAIAGLAIGIVAALVLTRTLRTLLFEVRAADPVTFLVITALLGIIALLASYVPALRASRVDPMVALRYE